jgi:hypothetical protein
MRRADFREACIMASDEAGTSPADGVGPVEGLDEPSVRVPAAGPVRSVGDRLLWTGTALLAVSGALVFASVLVTRLGVIPEYDYPVSDAMQGTVGLLLWICAALTLRRRTRLLGMAMAWTLSAAWVVRDLTDLEPGYLRANFGSTSTRLTLGAEALALIAAAVLGVVARQGGGVRPGAQSAREQAVPALRLRIALMVVGLAGAVAWIVGDVQTWLTGATSFADGSTITVAISCCTAERSDAWVSVSNVAGAVIVTGAVVGLAWIRPRHLGVGMLLGALVLMLPDITVALIEILAPQTAYVGFSSVVRYGSDLYGLSVTTTVHPGFYVTLAGFAALVMVLVVRAATGRVSEQALSGDGARSTAEGAWPAPAEPAAVPDTEEVFELSADPIDIVEF